MKIKALFAAALLMFVCFANEAQAQKRTAIKTNLLYDITATINAGVEFEVAPNWSIDVSANYNPIKGKTSLNHFMIQPEVRRWNTEVFKGHFFALNVMYGSYDFKKIDFNLDGNKKRRYDGNSFGVGLGWGYDWNIGKNLNLEVEAAVGYFYNKFDQYANAEDATPSWPDRVRHQIYPSKLAVSLVYIF